jgi:hypothetical protein
MNVYWVADNIKPHNDVELFFLFCSVYFFKKNHPTFITNIVVDLDNVDYYTKFELWDNIIPYSFSDVYLKGTDELWAIGKLDAMKSFKTPFCILDLDMFYTEPISFERDTVIFAFLEDGWNYYLTHSNPVLKSANIELFSKNNEAANVSFLHIPNDEIRDVYTKTALDWAYKLSITKGINGSHMILCEQKLLMDIIHRDSLLYKTLIPSIFKCYSESYIPPIDDFITNYFHLGNMKKIMRMDEVKLLEVKSRFFKIIYDRYPDVTKEYTKFRKKIIL